MKFFNQLNDIIFHFSSHSSNAISSHNSKLLRVHSIIFGT